MALLSKKTKESGDAEVKTSAGVKSVPTGILVMPRVSEKSIRVGNLNQYVFKVNPKANKLEIKKALESVYGINISRVNIVNVKGKKRNYGRTPGKMSDFKKAFVTLTKDSKKPAFTAE